MSEDHYHVMTTRLSYDEAKLVRALLQAGFSFSIIKHDENNEEIDNF